MKATLYSAVLAAASLGLLTTAPDRCHAQRGHGSHGHSSAGHYDGHRSGSYGGYYGYYGGRNYGYYPYRSYSYYPPYGYRSYYPYRYGSYYTYPYYYYPYAYSYYPDYYYPDYDYEYSAPRDYYSAPADTTTYGSSDVANTVTVGIRDNYFEPRTVEITAGTTVRWTNSGEQPHTITSYRGLFDSGELVGGNSYSFTFNEPGTYYYYCTLHPDEMWGTIVVR